MFTIKKALQSWSTPHNIDENHIFEGVLFEIVYYTNNEVISKGLFE